MNSLTNCLMPTQSDYQKQTVFYRRLLAEEQQRCVSARSEVLRVSIEAGNAKLALQTKLRQQRDRSQATIEGLEAQLRQCRRAAAEREASLQAKLRAAESVIQELELEAVRQTAETVQRSAEERTLLQQAMNDSIFHLLRSHTWQCLACLTDKRKCRWKERETVWQPRSRKQRVERHAWKPSRMIRV